MSDTRSEIIRQIKDIQEGIIYCKHILVTEGVAMEAWVKKEYENVIALREKELERLESILNKLSEGFTG